MSNYIYNSMVSQSRFTTDSLTQFSSDELSSDENLTEIDETFSDNFKESLETNNKEDNITE